MYKTIKKIIIIFVILILNLNINVLAQNNETELSEVEYTEEYKNWINLTDEEKENIIEPIKYKVNSEETTNAKLLENSRISIKNTYELLKSTELSTDKRFNLKNLITNNITIKDQKNTNTCWAFSAISALETNLALKNYNLGVTEKIYNFSERHMVYSKSQSFTDGSNKYGINKQVKDGGNMLMASSYLTNGTGAILEEDMPFENNNNVISLSDINNKTVQTTVEDTILFQGIATAEMTNYANNNDTKQKVEKLKKEIKEHIISNGSIYSGIYMSGITDSDYLNYDTASIYCNNLSKTMNHAISIVGWDDEYSKNNFTTKPSSDGAWIIRNSYGKNIDYTIEELREMLTEINNKYSNVEESKILEIAENLKATIIREDGNTIIRFKVGDNGYFYISYEDIFIYTNLWGIVNAKDEKTYDNLYQYDETGIANGKINYLKGNGDTYLANVFTRTTNKEEYLTSVGFDTSYQEGTFEVYVNSTGSEKTENKLTKVELVEGNQISLSSGYHTLKFKKPIKLTGNSFVVVIKIQDEAEKYEYFCFEDSSITSCEVKEGESFVAQGTSISELDWIDIGNKNDSENFNGNLCIKGLVVNEVEDNTEQKESKKEDDKNKDESSDYSNATASMQLNSIKSDTKTGEFGFEMELKIDNIVVKNYSDNYEHYYYLSEYNNLSNIQDDKWKKTTSKLEKNSNGTYCLKIIITDIEELAEVSTNDPKNIYVYIKENVTKEGETKTVISNAINIETISINDDEEYEDISDDRYIENEQDDTIYVGSLPHTGKIYIITIFSVIIAGGIIAYIKYKNLKEIK